MIKKNETTRRLATEDDVDYIVSTAMRVVPAMPHYKNVEMTREDTEIFVRMCLKRDDIYGVSVLCDSHTGKNIGFGMCYCVPLVFSKGKASHDIFLYIEPEWRTLQNAGKMYSAYKKWAKDLGASIIGASHTGGYESPAMDVLLRRNGFERIGATYHARV
jgi:GNAT superfamily N-acetyltransferase